MTVVDIGRMDRVNLRSVWPHEERNFTPWLVENLGLLSDALEVDLHSPSREVRLPGAGEADIVAMVRSDTGDEKAVIENQIEMGDDDHLMRLVGYAQAVDASVLIWVASEFSPRHEQIVEWLNRRSGSGLALYLVQASAWQIGENVGLHLAMRAGPEPTLTRSRSGTRTLATSLGEFYRPLVARLRAEGVPTMGRGGFRGRWRSFPTGYPNILYILGVDDGTMSVFVSFFGDDTSAAYENLKRKQNDVNAALADQDSSVESGIAVEWDSADRERWVSISRELLGAGDADDEDSRVWLFDNLLGFRRIMQPFLDASFVNEPAGQSEN